MNNHKCRFIFFASTSAIYGEPKKVPIKEDDVALPCNPYGDSKLKGEKIVIDSGVCYCIFRFANVSGASPSKFGGMMQDPPPYLISRLNQNISQGKKPTVMGVNLNTRDGTTIRDYIHVKDLALAIEMYIPFLLNGKSGIYNLGTGTGTTTLEIITNACKIHNIPIQYNETSKRPGDPDILTFSNEKAKITFGWEPKYTIYDMIKSDYDFRNSHKLK
jgi:UDP-glucose 4-epimerase